MVIKETPMRNKKSITSIIVVTVIAAAAIVGYQQWEAQRFALPAGIGSGNGRIEAKQVDITSKDSLRIKEILADEGDLVEPGQVLVRMDTATLNAQLAEAKANVAAEKAKLAIDEASIVRCKSELELANIEVERSRKLVAERAGSQEDFDTRKTAVDSDEASLAEAEAQLEADKAQVAVNERDVEVFQSQIDDATLTAPVRGRVLYRLAEPGEVVGAGGKVLTLVNLQDVYMEIYLPAEQAASTRIGAEARLTVDFAPGRAASGYVSFVSPEAQFTPKEVETHDEREKLMFRVKIQVPESLVAAHIERIKTGVRGMGYVKVDDSTVWPAWLENLVTPATPSLVEFSAKEK
jgi:HlyD family secretion protein